MCPHLKAQLWCPCTPPPPALTETGDPSSSGFCGRHRLPPDRGDPRGGFGGGPGPGQPRCGRTTSPTPPFCRWGRPGKARRERENLGAARLGTGTPPRRGAGGRPARSPALRGASPDPAPPLVAPSPSFLSLPFPAGQGEARRGASGRGGPAAGVGARRRQHPPSPSAPLPAATGKGCRVGGSHRCHGGRGGAPGPPG